MRRAYDYWQNQPGYYPLEGSSPARSPYLRRTCMRKHQPATPIQFRTKLTVKHQLTPHPHSVNQETQHSQNPQGSLQQCETPAQPHPQSRGTTTPRAHTRHNRPSVFVLCSLQFQRPKQASTRQTRRAGRQNPSFPPNRRAKCTFRVQFEQTHNPKGTEGTRSCAKSTDSGHNNIHSAHSQAAIGGKSNQQPQPDPRLQGL